MSGLEHISSYGHGIFARYHTFIIKEGKVTPVKR